MFTLFPPDHPQSLEDKGRGVQKSPRSDFWECGFGPPANSRSVQVDLTKKQLNYLRTKLGTYVCLWCVHRSGSDSFGVCMCLYKHRLCFDRTETLQETERGS